MEVAVCPANPPRQVKVESETAFRMMPYARSSQNPNRLLTSLFLFELPNPLLPEMPLRLLLGRHYPQLIGITICCTSSISALSPTHLSTRDRYGNARRAPADNPPRASSCSFQFLKVPECALLMPVEHQS